MLAKKILIVSQYYHPFAGGVETHAHQISQALSQKNHVEIVAVNFTGSKLPTRLTLLHYNLLTPAYQSYHDKQIPVHALTPTLVDRIKLLPLLVRVTPLIQSIAYHSLNKFGYNFYRWVFYDRLKSIIAGMDVVHSLAGGYLGWLAQSIAQELGIPFICTPFVHPHQWGDNALDVAYYQRCQAVIGLLKSDRDYLASIGVPDQILHTIGVSPDLPKTTDPTGFRQRHGLGDFPLVLYVGRMMPQKGAAALRSATQEIWRNVPNARIVFIGPSTVESAGWFENCDSRILYLGKVSQQEKADALSACDVFCMPSLSEILPTVYLEAWSYGKPVIGGYAAGLPDLIEGNGAGLAVPQQSDAIAAAIVRILHEPELGRNFGEAGQKLVEIRYSVKSIVEQLEALYLNVIAMQVNHPLGSIH
jgi:phosphatidyl-myo-inositol dimannoside synthase